jgi:hypothetical protein
VRGEMPPGVTVFCRDVCEVSAACDLRHIAQHSAVLRVFASSREGGLPQEKRALEKCGRVESTRSASDDEEGVW